MLYWVQTHGLHYTFPHRHVSLLSLMFQLTEHSRVHNLFSYRDSTYRHQLPLHPLPPEADSPCYLSISAQVCVCVFSCEGLLSLPQWTVLWHAKLNDGSCTRGILTTDDVIKPAVHLPPCRIPVTLNPYRAGCPGNIIHSLAIF